MADTSLIIGNVNWAVKETSLLGYNIIQSKYVPIEMTVSRATTATRVNSAGLIELVPRNLLNYSEQFNNVYWTQTNVTVTANTTAAPNNTMTADTVLANGTTNTHSVRTDLISFTAGTSYSLSVFVKKGTNDFVQLFVGSGIGGMFANFNINTGVVGTVGKTSGTDPTSSITNFGNGWYRCTMNFTATLTNDTVGRFAIVASASAAREETNTLATSVILWGAQLETGTTATEYFPTTDRFNIPRVDYSTGTASLLVEPARTNSVLYSEQFENASWGKSFVTATANTTTAPDETTTADTITGNGAVGARLIQSNSISFTASTSYSLSVFAKKDTNDFIQLFVPLLIGGMYANFNINTGVVGTLGTVTGTAPTSSITNFGNGWYRCTINFTATTTTSTVTSIGIVTSASAIRSEPNTLTTSLILWGAQVEAGSNATSYIPTTTIPLVRNADVISKTGISSLIGQTEGTIYAEFNNTLMTYAAQGYLIRIFADANNEVFIRKEAGTSSYTARWRANSVNVYTQNSIPVLNGNNKIAIAYKSTDSAVYLNGNEIGTNAGTGTFSVAPSIIGIGSSSTIDFFNDRIKSAILFPTRLTPGQLQTLTAII